MGKEKEGGEGVDLALVGGIIALVVGVVLLVVGLGIWMYCR